MPDLIENIDAEIFQSKAEGVFVDIGAYDGISGNLTIGFEMRGWTGICVEPNPVRFAELKENRRCVCIERAIVPPDRIAGGKTRFALVTCAADHPMTDQLSGVPDFMDTTHCAFMDECGAEVSETTEVPATTFNALMRRTKTREIDLCKIDTEGSEYAILKSIDFGRWRPRCFVIEINRSLDRITDFLTGHGYSEFGRDAVNIAYRH